MSQSKIHFLASCITYLPIRSISSFICSTEVALCIPGLAQYRIRLGKQLEQG